MSAGRPMVYGGPKGRKERDEDLLLFREMFKRERERNISLLQPVSDEFEPAVVHGSHPLYKIPSGKRGGSDFLGIESEKNDYDWLKTPPATPLFPSLEMEANDPNMVFHRELPILKNLKPSRFSGRLEEAKHGQIPKSPSSTSTTSTSSSQSVTPNARPISSSGKTNSLGGPMNSTGKSKKTTLTSNKKPEAKAITPRARTTKEITTNASTPRKQNTETKPRSRGVSPLVRSRIPATLPGFSDETPPNLITSVIPGRASSATRGRPVNSASGVVEPKMEVGKNRRQSCSPSVTRGRKVDLGEQNLGGKGKVGNNQGNGTLVMGSRMVEKMMNARRSGIVEERDLKTKNQNPTNEVTSFGRLMSRTSLDMALKHMEIKKNPNILPQEKSRHVKSSASPGSVLSRDLSSQTTPSYDIGNFRGQTSTENKQLIKKDESRNRCGFC